MEVAKENNTLECLAEFRPKFSEVISPLWDSFMEINFTEQEIGKVKDFVKRVLPAKEKEEIYNIDGGSSWKRHYTGRLGEMACGKYYGVDICDWSVGASKKYNEADLKKIGINAGIKSGDWGHFPVVHLKPIRPEVICLRNGNTIYICGWASVSDMQTHSRTDLIKSNELRDRGVKTGFWGFHLLKDLKDLK